MVIDSKFFGQIEAADEDIIYFEEGLLGLEDVKKFILVDIEGESSFKCLQSADSQEIAFIVISPWEVEEGYQVDIDDEELITLQDNDLSDIFIYSIVTLSQDKMTANLIGPIILNTKTKRGKQIVLNNSKYTTKHIIKYFAKKE
ncbi:flagellar assembly factor FliW [Oxobacter pfennigii]|uniref:Flagellar assembly factor FliW n=1 Tax=Oxobacter pfennigii TaxID=36849 RepID=A0A0P8YY27_9CLOT|nr:flagellar assembly protein FliW [Oxobacter pfennigii]KPU44663.1 flagellar assembly factor FliW [Oxobacter pfennigii]